MSLQYVIGPSGSGKSTYLFENVIREAEASPRKNFFVIVPEQFTMVTQRRLVSISGKKCILNVDVLSFERLAHRIFDELGTESRTVLEDTGKMLLLKRAVSCHMDELKVLGRNMKKRGYLDHVKSLISEFEQYRISPDDIEDMKGVSGMPGIFSDKMNDVGILYKEFLTMLREKYITSEMILDLLCEVVDKSSALRGSVMVFDGYTGFTPVQSALMKKLLVLSERVIVSATADTDMPIFDKPKIHELFAMTKKMTATLSRIAGETNTEILEPVRLSASNGRFRDEGALAHLEANLFRDKSEKYKKDTAGTIAIRRLSDTRHELRYVACEIQRLIREEGLSYRDIAVVCPDMSEYKSNVPGIFDRAKIPVFIDARSDVIFDPLLEFVGAAFDIVLYDFRMDSIIRLLRSGLCGIDTKETDRIENYLRASGLRGKRAYSHMFARCPGDMSAEELAEINESISFVRERLVRFYAEAEGADTVRDQLVALYSLISDFDAEHKLPDTELYIFMMNLMDQMADLLGDEEITFADFTDLMKSGLSEASMGRIPMTGDSVIFGDIERSRLSDIKVLFLIGAGAHSIPQKTGTGGILSQSERLLLAEADFELAPTERERSFMQRFYLYLILTKPSEKLYVTYPSVTAGKEAASPSYLIGVLKNMFEGLEEREILDDDPEIWTQTHEETCELLYRYLREYAAGGLSSEKEEVLFSLCRYMTECGEEDKLKEAMDSVFHKHSDIPISKEVMDSVFGKTVRMSVSRLESYVSCAYAYYLKYLLGLKVRTEHEIEASDMGSLYHSALENYSKLLKESGETWHSVSEEKQSELLEAGIKEAMSEFERADLFDEARERFVADNIRRTLRRSIWALTKQIRAGSFEPKHFEVSLEKIEGAKELEMSLSDDRKLRLSGKIDRVDTCETEDTVYVRIIDYKSGGKDIDLSAMYYGMQIQLFVYMGAAMAAEKKESGGKEVVPAGFFYYHIQDPYVESEIGDTKDAVDEKIFKELMVKGRVNPESGVPELMDAEIERARDDGSTYRSPVIPFSVKKDGDIASGSKVLTTDVIEQLVSYTNLLGREIGEKMGRGEYKVQPVCDKAGNTGCKYCPYHSVCGFDPSIEGFEYNRIRTLSEQDVIGKVAEALGASKEDKDNGEELD